MLGLIKPDLICCNSVKNFHFNVFLWPVTVRFQSNLNHLATRNSKVWKVCEFNKDCLIIYPVKTNRLYGVNLLLIIAFLNFNAVRLTPKPKRCSTDFIFIFVLFSSVLLFYFVKFCMFYADVLFQIYELFPNRVT